MTELARSRQKKPSRRARNRDPLFEQFLDELAAGGFTLGPIAFRMTQEDRDRVDPDGALACKVMATWPKSGDPVEFVVAWLTRATPKQLDLLVGDLRNDAFFEDQNNLIATPYLAEDQLAELGGQGVSAVDLCGNGVVVAQKESDTGLISLQVYVCRTGERNRYPSTEPLKNVYRRASSQASRAVLLRRSYPSLRYLCDEIERRGGQLAKPTVSKVVAALKEDRIVASDPDGAIDVTDPELLLKKLRDNFEVPAPLRVLRGKLPVEQSAIGPTLLRMATGSGSRITLSGAASTSAYEVMARGEVSVFYVESLSPFPSKQGRQQRERDLAIDEWTPFPNVELREVPNISVYFDARIQDGWPIASPIQVYLELMQGDKRDQEVARSIGARILAGELS